MRCMPKNMKSGAVLELERPIDRVEDTGRHPIIQTYFCAFASTPPHSPKIRPTYLA